MTTPKFSAFRKLIVLERNVQLQNSFFFKQKTAYEISACLVGSGMCIKDSDMMPESLQICDGDASEFKTKQQKMRDTRMHVHVKEQARLLSTPPTLDELHGQRLYIHPDVRTADVCDRCALLHLTPSKVIGP